MLLETLEGTDNDILIYSHNKFDFERNFKIVFKNEPIKKPKKISFFEVCEFIKEPEPKNLLIYRLLTNVNNLDSYSTKFGFFIRNNNDMELVYLDPVFALKDIKYLRFDFDPTRFRFKIQQVGLTFIENIKNEAAYSERFSFDLRAIEAQHQNDKIFADAIFALDETFVDEDFDFSLSDTSDRMTLVEDKQSSNIKLDKLHIREQENTIALRANKIALMKNALGIESEQQEKSLSEFISRHRQNKISEPIISESLIDLFKTTDSLERREPVVLRLEDD